MDKLSNIVICSGCGGKVKTSEEFCSLCKTKNPYFNPDEVTEIYEEPNPEPLEVEEDIPKPEIEEKEADEERELTEALILQVKGLLIEDKEADAALLLCDELDIKSSEAREKVAEIKATLPEYIRERSKAKEESSVDEEPTEEEPVEEVPAEEELTEEEPVEEVPAEEELTEEEPVEETPVEEENAGINVPTENKASIADGQGVNQQRYRAPQKNKGKRPKRFFGNSAILLSLFSFVILPLQPVIPTRYMCLTSAIAFLFAYISIAIKPKWRIKNARAVWAMLFSIVAFALSCIFVHVGFYDAMLFLLKVLAALAYWGYELFVGMF